MPFVLLTLIHWMAIYLVDCDILPLNNWWQMDNHKTLKGLVSDLFEPLACEQALRFGRAKQASRERASEGPRWLSTIPYPTGTHGIIVK